MENAYSAVIPAQAGIPWLRVLRDPCFPRDDGEEAFFDSLVRGNDGFFLLRVRAQARKRAHPNALAPMPALTPNARLFADMYVRYATRTPSTNGLRNFAPAQAPYSSSARRSESLL